MVTARFRLLGNVEVDIGGRAIDVGHSRQQCVLVTLLLDANRPVPVDRLLDRVWGPNPPRRGRDALYPYLSRLRQLLAGPDARIERTTGGYVLHADPDSVDIHQFRCLVARARTTDDDATAAALFEQGLALWRGEAFSVLETPWLDGMRSRLETERLAAELDRNDRALRLGRHSELLEHLEARTAEDPLDERLAGQFLLALYRSGRQADALALYDRIRHRLADELGTDPSLPLRRLYQSMLAADPELGAPTDPAVNRSSPTPRQLPALPSSFTGRVAELAELNDAMDPRQHLCGAMPVVAICGCGGIGKTWLALKWAHDNIDRFPDGQLHAYLRGFDPTGEPVEPAEVIRAFLTALGVEPATVPANPDAQAALFRSLVSGRRMLIVLDDARDNAHVASLLPGTATCAVVITSRHQLASLAARHGVRRLTLDALSGSESRALLARHLGAGRMTDEPAPVDAIVERCAGLPLALGIVAARASTGHVRPLARLADELRDAYTRLDALDAGELAVNLRAVLACSYRALPAEAAQALPMLSVAPGPDIDLAAAASLTATTVDRVRTPLRVLAGAHLIQEHLPGRYRMHDLIRLYAAELADGSPAGDGRLALLRVLDHYAHGAHAAARLLHPLRDAIELDPALPGVRPERFGDPGQALDWLISHHQHLLAAVRQACQSGQDRRAGQFAWALWTYLDRCGHWSDQVAVQEAALLAAQRLADQAGQARTHHCLGHVYVRLGRYDDAHRHFGHALGLLDALGDHDGAGNTHRGVARLLGWQGRDHAALEHAKRALELYRGTGNRVGQALALNAVGWYHAQLGEHRLALGYCQRALALHHEIGDRHGRAAAWDSLGYVQHHLGQERRAIACFSRALALSREMNDQYQEAETLTHLGDTHADAGQPDAAGSAWRQALDIFARLRHPDTARVTARLDRISDGHRPGPATVSAGRQTPQWS